MKKLLPAFLILLLNFSPGYSQITAPVIRANFGVDGDLRSNFFNGFVQSGNDDWYMLPGSVGAGKFVIDTTGAAAIVARYATDMPFRRTTLFRGMIFPPFSTINNRILLDAAFVRDFHGDDSTVFASGSNKNGDSPADWSCPVSQGIPDKNDILDAFVHVRRAGPNLADSLWMMGAMSLDNTTGNRYFDFEMYQTELAYDRPSLKFFGYGPDMGHTSWEFDAAGNITKPGDIIFSAEYQSSSLTLVEARIWIDRASLLVSPVAFAWSGQFDGAFSGAQFGYASIQPKGAGAYYTGLQCGNNTWGGPFSIILQNDGIATDYVARQFVEFSVNLSKLGLDPATSFTGNPCDRPFRSLLIKTRASASFTAELKDFVAPFTLFNVPQAEVETASTSMCLNGSIAEIHVVNPVATSIYDWTTTNGNIISSPTGQSILVDTPGTYIVTQYLHAACSSYATDTVQIAPSSTCIVLPVTVFNFHGISRDGETQLTWEVHNNQEIAYFLIQRSFDGRNFTTVGREETDPSQESAATYSFREYVGENNFRVYYRVLITKANNTACYSNIIALATSNKANEIFLISPNPARDEIQVEVSSSSNTMMKLDLFDPAGKRVATYSATLQRGKNVLALNDLGDKPRGMYLARLIAGDRVYRQKLLLVK